MIQKINLSFKKFYYFKAKVSSNHTISLQSKDFNYENSRTNVLLITLNQLKEYSPDSQLILFIPKIGLIDATNFISKFTCSSETNSALNDSGYNYVDCWPSTIICINIEFVVALEITIK